MILFDKLQRRCKTCLMVNTRLMLFKIAMILAAMLNLRISPKMLKELLRPLMIYVIWLARTWCSTAKQWRKGSKRSVK